MRSKNSKHKWFDAIYIITSIVLWLFFISMAIFFPQQKWSLITSSIAMIVWAIYTLVFAFIHWSWFISDLINAYKKQHDLFSGGFALVVLFLTLVLITNFNTHEAYATLINTLSAFFIAAMSALIGLMGVQYTIAIQERNRKEDLRRSSKPYLLIQAYVVDYCLDEDQKTFKKVQIGLHIRNISNHIGIPCSVKSLDANNCIVELDYAPLQHEGEQKVCIEICSDEPYRGPAHIELTYKDAFENKYKMQITFDLHKNPELANARILYDKFVLE